MSKFTESNFERTIVDLDGHEFVRCKFISCTMSYNGGPLPTLIDCQFINSGFVFGGAASNTIRFLGEIYQGLGDGGKQLIENTFEAIKSGQDMEQPAPADGKRAAK